MTTYVGASPARRMWPAAAMAILAAMALWAVPAMAAPADSSLGWVPEDAALYSSMLRGRQQIEMIGKSRAWAKLQAMPAVKMAWEMYEKQSAQPGNPMGKVKAALADPQVQDVLALLGDMFSEEVFLYADADTVGVLDLMQQINAATSYGPIVVQLKGKKDLRENQIQAMLALGVLSENLEAVKVPGLVLGFKLTDTSRAVLNMGKIEMVSGILLAQSSVTAGAMKRTKVGEHEYLVLTLRGDMVPWDKLPLEKLRELEPEDGCVDKIIEKIKKENVVVAVGLRGNYLLAAIGSSTDVLARLGQGKSLAQRPELKPVAEMADKQLAGVGYLSQPLYAVLGQNAADIDNLLEVLDQVLPEVGLDEDVQKQIRKDAAALAADVKGMLPEYGALVEVSFLAERGIESYSYNHGKRPDLDASKPLGLLSHVGGTPLLAVVGRHSGSVKDYDLLVKWLSVAYGYFEKYGLPEMQESEREKFEQFADAAGPILERLDRANRELLIPALDGQIGLVLDGQLKSKQFVATLPATGEPMPMVEPAILLGLRDADRMRRALEDYWEIFHDALSAAADVEPDVSKLVIPDPTTIDTSDGVLYAFVPPEKCPVDKQIAPNVGVGKDVCVFSISRAHTERLMKSAPLAAGGVLSDPSRPLAAAAVFDWAGLLKAATPWIDLATDQIVRRHMSEEAAKSQLAPIKEQVHTAIEVLSALRRITSETYIKDGVIVTHTLVEIKDVE